MAPQSGTGTRKSATVALLSCLASFMPLHATAAEPPPRLPPADSACPLPRYLRSSRLDDHYADFARVAELAGRSPVRPRVMRRASSERIATICGDGGAVPWIRRLDEAAPGTGRPVELLSPSWLTVMNTSYPKDRNNGALWSGRGVSTEVQGGVTVRWGLISVALAPALMYQQNRDFDIAPADVPGHSPFIYPWHATLIDWPQRFGADGFWTLDPGQSHVRADVAGVKIGASTENLWWGPAQRHPLLLSNTGPGFPHIFLGTSRPVNVGVGRFEAEAFWGRVSESDYFDGNPGNDRRLFIGMVADLEPRWLPGLFLGFTRTWQFTDSTRLAFSEYFTRLVALPLSAQGGATPGNGLGSLFARWVLPQSGFEAYVEWGREDFSADLKDFIREPDHSQGYTVGFQKVVPGGVNWVRIRGELTHLEGALPLRGGRGVVTFYTNSEVNQGHTHRGQLLGAAIGPGSDAQFLGADVFARWGRIGAYAERVRYDDDAYFNTFARFYGMNGHDVELSGGLDVLVFTRNIDVRGALAFSHRYNRNFIGLDGVNQDFRTDGNWHIELEAGWWPPFALGRKRPTAGGGSQ